MQVANRSNTKWYNLCTDQNNVDKQSSTVMQAGGECNIDIDLKLNSEYRTILESVIEAE